jgi:cytochrome c-type biogenesis protein CcmH/NrfG
VLRMLLRKPSIVVEERSVDEDVPSPDLYYEVASRRLSEQMQQIDGLDNKSSTIISFGSVVLPVYSAIVALGDEMSYYAITTLVLAGVVYLFLAYYSYCAYQVSEFSGRPHADDLAERSRKYNPARMKRWVAEERRRSINQNRKAIQRKASYVSKSLVSLTVLAALLTISAILTLLF